MKICLAGGGAFGKKHLDALKLIDGVELASVVGRRLEPTQELAAQYGIPHATTDLAESLAMPDIDAVILATPTGMHAEQGLAAMDAGKHVLIEIPMADSLADSEALVAKQKETGLVAMAGHVRRFNPSHQYVHNLISAGELSIQQMDVQTYFFRRKNISADGSPRSWTDHLLWHHAASHHRPVHVPDRRDGDRGAWRPGPDPSRAWHRHGHVDHHEDAKRPDLHPVAVFQQ